MTDEAKEWASFELYEIERGYPDVLVAEVSGTREQAWREIQHYAMMYARDGPVAIREGKIEADTGDHLKDKTE